MSYRQETITPYHDGDKASQVETMFDHIAPSYDKLNHRLSWNIDRGWRRKAIGMLAEVKESIINAYELKTGLARKVLAKMMEEETWMDCNKAVELGFADGVLSPKDRITAKAAPVLFSQRVVDAALVNKIAGHPVKPLYERLNHLRPLDKPVHVNA
jgi:hypothetical protein